MDAVDRCALRIELEGGVDRAQGVHAALQPGERHGAVGQGEGVIRLQLQGTVVGVEGLLVAEELRQGEAALGVRGGVVGAELQRGVVGLERLLPVGGDGEAVAAGEEGVRVFEAGVGGAVGVGHGAGGPLARCGRGGSSIGGGRSVRIGAWRWT